MHYIWHATYLDFLRHLSLRQMKLGSSLCSQCIVILQQLNMGTYDVKKKLSRLSGMLIHTQFGAMYTLGTITPYIASYMKYHGSPSIEVVDVSINYPIFMIFLTSGQILSMFYLQNFVPPKILCFIGTWGFALGVFLASFTKSLSIFTFFYSCFACFCCGVSYIVPIKNCYLYYPDKKGLSAGICMMGYGVGSFFYNQVFRALVNPSNVPSDQNHFFPKQVADNFPFALRIIALIYFIVGSIGSLCFYDQSKEVQMKAIDSEAKESLISYEEYKKTVLQERKSTKKDKEIKKLKNFFKKNPQKRMEIFKLFLCSFTSAVFAVFISYNYKEYGEIIVNNDRTVTLMGSLGCVGSTSGRIFLTLLFDYLSFRKLLAIVNSGLLLCCLLCILTKNEYVYLIIVIMTYFLSGSFYGVMPTQVFRICGDQVGGIVYTFVYAGFAFASISQFVFHEAVIRRWGDSGFSVAFIVFGVFQTLSILFVLLFKFTYVEGRNKELSESPSDKVIYSSQESSSSLLPQTQKIQN